MCDKIAFSFMPKTPTVTTFKRQEEQNKMSDVERWHRAAHSSWVRGGITRTGTSPALGKPFPAGVLQPAAAPV